MYSCVTVLVSIVDFGGTTDNYSKILVWQGGFKDALAHLGGVLVIFDMQT